MLLLGVLSIGTDVCAAAKYDENSPYSVVPVGSRLVLKRPVSFPPNEISIKLRRVGDYPESAHPYQQDITCDFDLYTRNPKTRVIEPTEFRIIKVVKGVEDVSAGQHQVASLFGYPTSGPAWETHTVTLYLKSDKYPDVYSVSCQYQDNAGEGIPISVTLLRWALGRVFELRLAQE